MARALRGRSNENAEHYTPIKVDVGAGMKVNQIIMEFEASQLLAILRLHALSHNAVEASRQGYSYLVTNLCVLLFFNRTSMRGISTVL